MVIVQVTVLSSQPGQTVLRQLEHGLKDSDLVSLRRLLVVHITVEQNLPERESVWSPEPCSTETMNEQGGEKIHFNHLSAAVSQKLQGLPTK